MDACRGVALKAEEKHKSCNAAIIAGCNSDFSKANSNFSSAFVTQQMHANYEPIIFVLYLWYSENFIKMQFVLITH